MNLLSKTTREPLSAYLQVLAGDAPESSFLEVRYRARGEVFVSEFAPVHACTALADVIRRRAAQTDIYVGCAPRNRRAGSKDAVDQVWVLWAECDGPDAARAALAYRPNPTMVIASGSGPNLHAYWPLRDALPPREAEVANLRLAHAIGADRACYDAARILRPPTTWNHKRRPPTRVQALRLDLVATFTTAEVLSNAPEVDAEPIERRWRARGNRDVGDDALLRIAPAVYVGRLLGVESRAGRKVRCPFHNDVRPSLHVYPSAARGWSCFSCGRGGSIYDLAAALWGKGTRGRHFVEVRERLQEQFAPELARSHERV